MTKSSVRARRRPVTQRLPGPTGPVGPCTGERRPGGRSRVPDAAAIPEHVTPTSSEQGRVPDAAAIPVGLLRRGCGRARGGRCARARRHICPFRPVRPVVDAGGAVAGDPTGQKGGWRVSFTPIPAPFSSRSGAITPLPGCTGAGAHPKVTRQPPFSTPPTPAAPSTPPDRDGGSRRRPRPHSGRQSTASRPRSGWPLARIPAGAAAPGRLLRLFSSATPLRPPLYEKKGRSGGRRSEVKGKGRSRHGSAGRVPTHVTIS